MNLRAISSVAVLLVWATSVLRRVMTRFLVPGQAPCKSNEVHESLFDRRAMSVHNSKHDRCQTQ